jgi:hypothetical protein
LKQVNRAGKPLQTCVSERPGIISPLDLLILARSLRARAPYCPASFFVHFNNKQKTSKFYKTVAFIVIIAILFTFIGQKYDFS